METLTETTFGARIVVLRKKLDLSQEELAKLADVSVRTIVRYEARVHPPEDTEIIERIAEKADADLTWLLTGETNAGVGVGDHVVASLLRQGEVTKAQVRGAELQWQRDGQKDTLWRALAVHQGVNQEAVYAEAARIYAFRRAEIDVKKLDTGFIRRVVESFTPEQKERLIALRVLPLEYEIDAERGALRLIFATRDPMRPETLRLIHALQLDNFELRYAPETEIAPLLDALFPRRGERPPSDATGLVNVQTAAAILHDANCALDELANRMDALTARLQKQLDETEHLFQPLHSA